MEATADAFACLANPIRRRVLDELRGGPSTVEALWQRVTEFKQTSRSSFSEHLAVLRKAGMVSVSVRKTERVYELDPAGFAPVFDWVDHYEAFWSEKLDNLSRYLDQKSDYENP